MQLTGNLEKESNYYDAIYSRGYNTRNYYPLYNETIRLVEKRSIPRKILEIGCGVGDLGKMLLNKGYQYRGFDFSEQAIECSRRLCPAGDFRIGDAYKAESYLPVDYDVAVALEVLEHLDDLKIIENIPAGVHFIASVPDYDDTAHLRIYKDYRKDIIERFSNLLEISDILTLAGEGVDHERKKIFLFYGTRIGRADAPPLEDNAKSHIPEKRINAGRNEPCPCGSGRKYKKCCLK